MVDPLASFLSTQPSGESVTIKREGAGIEAIPSNEVGGDGLNASIDNDINMTAGEEATTAAGNSAGQNGAVATTVGHNNTSTSVVPVIPRVLDNMVPLAPPTKKESSLREFMSKMDEYAPIIPDAVTAHYLTVAGLPPPGNGPNQTPPHLARLLALATQKFVADIASDAYQYSRIRASNNSSANNPMGGLSVAAGLSLPGSSNIAGAAGAGAGSESSKGKGGASNTHLGIQRPGFGGGGQGGSGQGRTVLTMEDLGMAVSEYGVTLKRGEFYR